MNLKSKWAIPVILTSLLAQHALAENTSHDVIVVGAGAAGMHAAKQLISDGYDVLIIEADSHIGGRIHTITLGDTRIEMGAEEHYAKQNNPVFNALTAIYGNNVYGDGYIGREIYSLDGGSNTCWDDDDDDNWSPSNELDCGSQSDVTKAYNIEDDFWSANFGNNDTVADWIDSKYNVKEGDRTWHLYAASYFEGIYAGSPKRLGAKGNINAGNQWTLSEGDISILVPHNLGYVDALKAMWWDDVVANSDLLLNSPVTAIEAIDSSSDGDYVAVSTATGDVHTARHVIVTVSIGVLQDEVIDFIPDLPAATVTAYNRIGFDDGMKVAMQFSGEPAFWESEGEAGWMAFEGYTGACWAPTNYKEGYTGTPDNILMCYPMGDNGTALNNIAIAAGGGAAGEQAIIDTILAELDSSFPNAPGQASATIVNYFVQNWGGDPLTSGVYSFETTTSWTNNYNARDVLQDPVANNRIFFAGEGTNKGNGATAPGAMMEGERAANDVDSVGSPNNPLPPVLGPDVTAPVVTLNGDATIITFQNQTFTDPGATANDDRDGSVTVSVSGSVNTNTLGDYILTYSASDAAGNIGTATRTVTVSLYVDLIAPVITLNGNSSVTLEFGEAYVEAGATASDNDDGDVTANIQISGTVDSSTSDTYTITYTVSDAAGNEGTATRSVTVGPEPGITLIPTKSVFAPGEAISIEYTEGSGSNKDWIGVYPADSVPTNGDSGSAEANITLWSYTNGNAGIITNWQNSSVLPEGNYVAILFSNDTYNFFGEFGYFAVGTVTGPDETAPVITLNGGSVTLNLNEAYVEAGASASDNVDGDISANIQISGSVNSSVAGTYTITYSVADAAGNSATATRTVTVLPEGEVDTVILGTVAYNVSLGRLVVVARSSDGIDVELTLEGFGIMDEIHSKKADRYRMYYYIDQVDAPLSVTVTSANGGTATKTVVIK